MTCIVSAYYKIPSKQTHAWYTPYLVRWFRSVGKAPNVHFFTTEDVKTELLSLVDVGGVVFHILPFASFTAMNLGREFWERQYARDPERYHSPELGMMWYEKRHFVRRVMEIDPSDVFIWCDAGCVRTDTTEKAARGFGTRNLSVNDNTLHLQQVAPMLDKPFYRFPDKTVGCGIMIGNRSAWQGFTADYEERLREYDNAGIPAIMDQYPVVRCVRMNPTGYTLHAPPVTIDEWFLFLEIF